MHIHHEKPVPHIHHEKISWSRGSSGYACYHSISPTPPENLVVKKITTRKSHGLVVKLKITKGAVRQSWELTQRTDGGHGPLRGIASMDRYALLLS